MHQRSLPFLPVSLALLVALPACGGGGGGNSSSDVSIALTDAASDEVEQFEVDVSNVTLLRDDGSTVSVLTRRARVDFAQLEDLSELIVGSSVPAGAYTGMTMIFDFGTSSVVLKGLSTPATVLDAAGRPITGSQQVRVNFATTARPGLGGGRHQLWLVDLDLDQSITPDLLNNRVVFNPAITAAVDPSNPKPASVTGILSSVDATSLALDKRDSSGNLIGTVQVDVTSSTLYQVDGVAAVGSAGMALMAGQTPGTTRVFAQGVVNGRSRMTAVAVEAGAGTFGNGQDWVDGVIVARNNTAGQDATLTVLGRGLDGTTRAYNTSFAVSVFRNVTKVLRRGVNSQFGTDDLNVGQRVLCFGQLTGTAMDCTASSAVVRCVRTSVFGVAAGAPSSNLLTVNVARFGLRATSALNFTVGGIAEADPAAYTVDVTGLAAGAITTGSKVRVIGLVNPVGVGGDANFDADAIVDRSSVAQLMVVIWPDTVLFALNSATAAGLMLDLSTAAVKRVEDGFSSTVLGSSPPLQLAPQGTGFYRSSRNRVVEVDPDFATFVAALNIQIAAGRRVKSIVALGSHNAGTQVFTTSVLTVFLE